MKLAAILLFAAAMHVSAKGLTQDKISLSLKNAPLEKVFGEIEAQSGFVFIYKDETVKDKRISIQVSNVTLSQALDECLKGQSLSYQIVGKSVAIKANRKDTDQIGGEPTGTPPLIDVKGKVLNEKGDPLEGVTVRVKGTEKFTMTDKNGEFSLITVERDAVLLFTHITMESFELKVSGKTELLINLRTKVSALGEVTVTVNTGYQQVNKERFVGSVATMDSASYNRRAGMNIIDRLDGMVAGVVFDKKSTGRQYENIQIRGISTLGGANGSSSAPLIIVDKFPFTQDLNTINPNDVESITVLKDAAAASIWGARAGNGVIVITTKKGNYNQSLKISGRSNITVEDKPDLYYYPQMKVSDFIDAEIFFFNKGAYDANLANTSTWPAISPVVELLANRRSGKISVVDSASQVDAYKNLDVRRQLDKYAYRRAITQQHYLSLNAGNNILNYALSVGYNRSLNNVQNSKANDQFTISSNAAFRPVKGLDINTAINFSQSVSQSANFSMPSKTVPYAQLADLNGTPLAIPYDSRIAYRDTAGAGKLLDWRFRPLEEPKLTDRKNVTQFIQLNLGVAYRFTSWLNASLNYQTNRQTSDNNENFSLQTYYTRNLINRFTNLTQTIPGLRNPIPVGGIRNSSYLLTNSQNARAQINFNKNFASRHLINALVAGEISEVKVSGYNNTFYGYNKETDGYQSAIDYATGFPVYGESRTEQIPNGNILTPAGSRRFVSWIGNVSYTFNDRYMIYFSSRKDGSNVFGVNTNKKWNPLWSTGISWDIFKENFYHIDWMSTLRLRASYGYTGNPGSGSGFATIRYNQALAPYTNLTVAGISDAPNPDLKWEQVGFTNFAMDFSLFRKRLSGSIDVFHKKATDVIASTGLAPSTGVINFIINYANLKGNGFEINLNSNNLVGKFQWQTRAGLSYAKMIVTKLHNNLYKAREFVGYALHASEGKVAYGMASYKWEGLDPMTGDPRGHLNKQVSISYNDIFNDSVSNQVFHGSAIPLYSGFIGNSFSWKNFTLSANITYRFNFYFRKPSISYSQLFDNWQGHADYSLRWQKPGDEMVTNVPSFTYPLDQNRDLFYRFSEVNVLRGDNIRLQDVRLDYNWNSKKKKMPFSSLQVFVYANNLNLILWRKNKSNLDPDFVDAVNFSGPTPKTWTGGVSFTF
ncbi:MAG TPA: SusC/RagA family TonB-linked outer membrane protein [Niastella sp.]